MIKTHCLEKKFRTFIKNDLYIAPQVGFILKQIHKWKCHAEDM